MDNECCFEWIGTVLSIYHSGYIIEPLYSKFKGTGAYGLSVWQHLRSIEKGKLHRWTRIKGIENQ